jgi:hypothetical protein
VLEPLAGGWHDTGDIVTIDAAGFIAITGRAKRFAKIAGEMVSPSAVEAMAAALWPQAMCCGIDPDARKGERIEWPIWVNRVNLAAGRLLPVLPRKRPWSGTVQRSQKQTNAVSVFPSLYGPIEFGDKACQACCSPRTGFAQTLKNAYPLGTRRGAGIWESGA